MRLSRVLNPVIILTLCVGVQVTALACLPQTTHCSAVHLWAARPLSSSWQAARVELFTLWRSQPAASPAHSHHLFLMQTSLPGDQPYGPAVYELLSQYTCHLPFHLPAGPACLSAGAESSFSTNIRLGLNLLSQDPFQPMQILMPLKT